MSGPGARADIHGAEQQHHTENDSPCAAWPFSDGRRWEYVWHRVLFTPVEEFAESVLALYGRRSLASAGNRPFRSKPPEDPPYRQAKDK